jgi:hypothetical protein
MHTLLDLRGNFPSFIHVSNRKLHDVHALDLLLPEAGLDLEASRYTLLQIPSITLFEKMPLQQALAHDTNKTDEHETTMQLNLFAF